MFPARLETPIDVNANRDKSIINGNINRYNIGSQMKKIQ